MLDALGAPAGAGDDRTQGQRYHDALAEAMRRLVAGGLLPERAGQPVKALVHVSLADLMRLEGSSALAQEWTDEVRTRWAAARAAASESGSDGGAWLDGKAAEAATCDASLTPLVTGAVDLGALDELIRLCAHLGRLNDALGIAGGAGAPGCGMYSSIRPSARPSPWSPAPAGSRPSCGAASSAPGSAGRACRWTWASAETSRPRSAGPSSNGTSTASSPVAATRPPQAAKCITSRIKQTAARARVRRRACTFHHQVVIHRLGWTVVLNPDGTTTAWNKDKTKIRTVTGHPPEPGNTPAFRRREETAPCDARQGT